MPALAKWLRALIALAALWTLPIEAQTFGSPQLVITAYKYTNITGDATTLVKSGPGIMHGICINTPTATETSTVYDSITASGTKIATLTSFTGLPGCYIYDVAFTNGLTIVTAVASGDITVSYY